LCDHNGDAVLAKKSKRDGPLPHIVPCELVVAVEPSTLPPDWPTPEDREYDMHAYKKHIFMMTRGTRGDVQPFVALARGLAERLGWMVTIQTELKFRDFVLTKGSDVENGVVRFLPSGGDTETRIERPEAAWAMKQKSEAVQSIMLAASESNFFGSLPVYVHHVERLQRSSTPVDLVIAGFTLMGAAMVVSEYCHVPMAGFILQPTCIPSSDEAWRAIVPIKGSKKKRHTEDSAPQHSWGERFTTHDFLNRLKKMAELNIPQMRARFGLDGNVHTWPTLLALEIPMVIPIQPGTIEAPADWHDWIQFTDFIFLTSKAKSKNAFGEELYDFIQGAKEAGRKLLAMTFSSMPVSREKMLLSALNMIALGNTPLSVIYIGKRYDNVSTKCKNLHSDLVQTKGRRLEDIMDELKNRKLFIEIERAPFDILFREMDAFVIHGGLGTTVDALRMHKPIQVSGVLLMDQRFWGQVCEQKGVGPEPIHIDNFPETCVDFINEALKEDSVWKQNAEKLTWGEEGSDGVKSNVEAMVQLVAEQIEPVDTRTGGTKSVKRGFRGSYSRIGQLFSRPEPHLPRLSEEGGMHRRGTHLSYRSERDSLNSTYSGHSSFQSAALDMRLSQDLGATWDATLIQPVVQNTVRPIGAGVGLLASVQEI